MSLSFSVLFGAALFSFLALRFLTPIAFAFKLLDIPQGRKTHAEPTPLIGGLSVYISVLLMVAFAAPLGEHQQAFLIGGTIVLLVGMFDDFRPLGVRVRLLFQMLAIACVIALTDLKIEQLPNLVGSGSFELGIFAIPFTFIAVIGLMNAFNMVDGIDGLAGSLAIIAIAGIAAFATLRGTGNELTLVLLLGAAIIPYLAHNLGLFGKKVFLGDAGSMFIGFVLAWTLIAQVENEQQTVSSTSVLWCVALPVIDTLGVMVRRIRKGHSPFKPDRDHLHHIIQRAGLSTKLSLMVISSAAVVILALGLIIETVVPHLALLLFLSLFGVYLFALLHAWKVQKFFKK
ncbi:Undecaprenyl-phosphate alpha-N-acetylglucosaminyl 1-phosphate transferase [Marinobacterium sp. xm-d-420]|uniref:MraY family glycosyltransferase n=1 Tax=Marinobacterium sp. xm-d-420 TaxID=2497737 RepID=UPI0015687D6D|nr:MraY family glycosyltransferase [Marinobacterium sp. xm-d-420]NRP26552.1 Undecaprenyl-phosphate alpha-N-acetylglucosaminyl 1-phosphate transferase [Marinobacterium sp. xm-d-420]